MSPDPDRELVSIMEAVAVLGVSRQTIYRWMGERRIECVRTAGGQPRIYADTLTRPYLDSTLPLPKAMFSTRRGQSG